MSDSSATPRASVALKVLVVNDPKLAEAINRLRGEWAEREGGTLTAETRSWAKLAAGKALDADVVIFPTRYLGELSSRGWLRPMRDNVLQSDAFDASDLFPLVRHELIRWGGQVMALPMGIDLPVLCYRADHLEEPQRRPPASWKDYGEDIGNGPVKDESVATLPVTWQPLYSWAAPMLLARAATYAVTDNRTAVLFDPITMKPLLVSPPFVRALQELRELDSFKPMSEARDETDRQLRDPRAASWNVATGYALETAIGLPPAGHRNIVLEYAKLPPADGSEVIGWAQLPGAEEVYDSSSGRWEKRERAHRVSLLGVGDRLVGVTTSSRNVAGAFKLTAWLASGEISTQLARAGDGTMPVRRSLAAAAAWYDPKLTANERTDLGGALDGALGRQDFLMIPRIPGIDEYLAALDDAVKDAIAGKVEPEAALEQAADKWERITEARGRATQQLAYLKHLGIAEP